MIDTRPQESLLNVATYWAEMREVLVSVQQDHAGAGGRHD